MSVHDDLLKMLMESDARSDSASAKKSYHTPDWFGSSEMSVEAKVKEFRDRVQLDSLTKEASEKGEFTFPLYLKKAEVSSNNIEMVPAEVETTDQDKADEEQAIEIVSYIRALVESRKGRIDIPAVIFTLKRLFGDEIVRENLEEIQQIAQRAKERYDVKLNVQMPRPLGQLNQTFETEDNKLFPLTDHLK